MLKAKEQVENAFPTSVAQSLQIINRFLNNFPPEEIKRCTWDLIVYAFGSEDANGLTHLERSNLLFFYEQLNKVCDALMVVDERLMPLFAEEE